MQRGLTTIQKANASIFQFNIYAEQPGSGKAQLGTSQIAHHYESETGLQQVQDRVGMPYIHKL